VLTLADVDHFSIRHIYGWLEKEGFFFPTKPDNYQQFHEILEILRDQILIDE
jgi:hypothetical protein